MADLTDKITEQSNIDREMEKGKNSDLRVLLGLGFVTCLLPLIILVKGAYTHLASINSINDPRYDFKGKIKTEQVEFKNHPNESSYLIVEEGYNLMSIVTSNGDSIVYLDRGNNLKVDEFSINGTPYGDRVSMMEAQRRFENYLRLIEQEKITTVKAL